MGGYTGWALDGAKLIAGQQQANRAAKAQAEQISAQNAYLTQQQEVRAKQQRDLLKQQLASTRARLAAGGIGVGSGSGQALMSGMVRDSEEQLSDSDALLQARQASSAAGSGSGGGLLQGLETLQKGMSWLDRFPGARD